MSPSAIRLQARLRSSSAERLFPRTRGTRLLLGAVMGVLIAGLAGLAEWVWPVLAVPLAIHVIATGRVYAPRALGVWIGFVSMAVVAVVSAGDGFLPIATYGAATIAFLFAYNMPEDEVPDAVVIRVVAVVWLILAVSGLVGVFAGTTEFPSIGTAVMNPAEGSDLETLTLVRFADPLRVGEPSSSADWLNHRPNGILPFTNHWGSALVMFLGAALILRVELRGRRAARWFDVLAIATLVPFVLSRNRWAWLTFPIMVTYLVARFWRPNPKFARGLIGLLLLALIVTAATPLRGVISDRLQDEGGHRSDQYELSLELVGDSPWFGYGAIQQGENEEGEARELGADSQILYTLVSYGIPATLLLFVWFVMVALASRRIDTEITFVTHLALLVLLFQSPSYVMIPHRLVLVMLLAGAVYRHSQTRSRAGRAPILVVSTPANSERPLIRSPKPESPSEGIR